MVLKTFCAKTDVCVKYLTTDAHLKMCCARETPKEKISVNEMQNYSTFLNNFIFFLNVPRIADVHAQSDAVSAGTPLRSQNSTF